jgi:hypothetical protein
MAFGYVLFLILLGLVGWGFVEAIQANPAVVGSIGVAVIGVFGVVWQQHRSEQARLREANRDRMTPIYYELLGTITQIIESGKAGEGVDPDTEAFFRDLKARQLMLGASSQMLVAFNKWQRRTAEIQKEDDNELGAVVAWEELLLAIRADLGHRDSGLPRGELLRLFISDYDEYFGSAG